jgi:hypothetical protein
VLVYHRPDPKLMVDQLKELGVELMVSPYSHSVGKASYNWPGAVSNHYLATDKTGLPLSFFPHIVSLKRTIEAHVFPP